MIRPLPSMTYPEFDQVRDRVTAVFNRHGVEAMQRAQALMAPSTPASDATADIVIALGCHIDLRKQAGALNKVLNTRQPHTLVLTGGRTSPRWAPDETEAGHMHQALLARNPDWQGRIRLEREATSTRENFAFVAELCPEILQNASRIAIFTHTGLAGRALMTARRQFAPLLGDRFDEAVFVDSFDSGVARLDPALRHNQIETVTRMLVYAQNDDLRPGAADKDHIDWFWTRASEYASKGLEGLKYVA